MKPKHSKEETDIVWMKAETAGIRGRSEELYKAVSSALNAAPTEVSILLHGPNGCGKELLARLIHDYSKASGSQFLALNCAALSPNLFESELFGHEKGAFTDAHKQKKGAFELAHGGTLFLDELGEMPLTQQAKVLRVMQIGRCRRVGSDSAEENIDARPRIIAATNIDVEDALQKGKLREDLFYRFTRHIRIPSLAERGSDISLLAEGFLEDFTKNYGLQKKKYPTSIEPAAIELLQTHSWPGNVRELRAVIESAFIDARGKMITKADLSFFHRQSKRNPSEIPEPHEGFDSKRYLDSVRDRLYGRALELAKGNLSAASLLLGISKQALQQWNDKRA